MEDHRDSGDPDGWGKYAYYVLEELKSQKKIDDVQAKAIQKNCVDIAKLKIKCTLLGLGGGGIPLIIYEIIKKLT